MSQQELQSAMCSALLPEQPAVKTVGSYTYHRFLREEKKVSDIFDEKIPLKKNCRSKFHAKLGYMHFHSYREGIQ